MAADDFEYTKGERPITNVLVFRAGLRIPPADEQRYVQLASQAVGLDVPELERASLEIKYCSPDELHPSFVQGVLLARLWDPDDCTLKEFWDPSGDRGLIVVKRASNRGGPGCLNVLLVVAATVAVLFSSCAAMMKRPGSGPSTGIQSFSQTAATQLRDFGALQVLASKASNLDSGGLIGIAPAFLLFAQAEGPDVVPQFDRNKALAALVLGALGGILLPALLFAALSHFLKPKHTRVDHGKEPFGPRGPRNPLG
ncbi:MAG TPA: hypothetical protein VMY37_38175 [Thermoguttaceae bacterium]|nr:hypothetical protein [Thermoguttaceae bacterium]